MHVIAVRHFIVPFTFTIAGGILALWRVARDRGWLARQPIVAVGSLLVLAVIAVGATRNAKQVGSFIAHASELSMADQLDDLGEVLSLTRLLGGERVVTDDNNLVRTGFLHLPRHYFGLPEILVDGFESDDWAKIRTGEALPSVCLEEQCVLVITERISGDEAVTTACASGECHRFDRWTIVPADSVLQVIASG
jgi:hypothetical protein